MKKTSIAFATLFTMGLAVSSPSFTNSAMAFNGPHTQAGSAQPSSKKNCGGLFRQAKKSAKNQAKRFCRMTYGSGGRSITNVSWSKNQCSKPNNSANGTLTFYCK